MARPYRNDAKTALLSKIKKTDTCWLWTDHTSDGYGQLSVNGKNYTAHRIAWEIFRGPIPDGLFVLHQCDVRSCVNPDHLFLGTKRDSARDCMSKNRHGRGSRNGNAVVTEDDVIFIRAELSRGVPRKVLAERFGLTKSGLCMIAERRTWKHVQ